MSTDLSRAPAGLLIVGDVHLSSVPPERRRASYAEEVLAKLSACAEIARRENLQAVILGDMFHRPREPDEALKTRLIRVLRSFPCTPLCNVGNHDARGEGLQDGDSLMLLVEGGHVLAPVPFGEGPEGRRTPAPPRAVPFADLRLSSGVRVGVGMVPWGAVIPDDVSSWFPESDGTVLFTHHDIAFPGAYPKAAPVRPIPGCGLVVNGHMHLRQAVLDAGGTFWCNFGSMTSTSADAVGHRPVAVAFRPDREDIFEFHDLGGEDGSFDLSATLRPDFSALRAAAGGGGFAALLAAEMEADALRTAGGGVLEEELSAFLDRGGDPLVRAAVMDLFARSLDEDGDRA